MHKAIWASTVAVATFTFGSEALAQANLHSADVLRPGDNMIYGEAGWPDVAFGFQHGVSDKVDVGVRLGFIYGWEFAPAFPGALGLGVRVPIRITPLRREKVSLQIHIDPGLKFDSFGSGYGCVQGPFGQCIYAGPYNGYFFGDGLRFGLWLYFGLDVGIHLTREATLTFGFDMPVYVNFTNGVYGAIPLLFGPGFEYHINDNMSVGGQLKLGPTIIAYSAPCGATPFGPVDCTFNPTFLGLLAQGFFAYRL
jgi:hypothetical protein